MQVQRKRILFVGPENERASELDAALDDAEIDYVLVHARSAEDALSELARYSFEAVIAGMDVATLDGSVLMELVKHRYPGISRIAICPKGDSGRAIEALRCAHQVLAPNASRILFKQAVQRACELHSFLKDDRLREMMGRLDRLPSVPTTYMQLVQAAGNLDINLLEVVLLIERDTAMCAKILQIVNSPYFGLPQRVTSVSRAVGLLGLELIRCIALTAHLFATAEGFPRLPGLSQQAMQAHGLLTGRIARRLVANPREAEHAFTAGLLHEIGRIVLAVLEPVAITEVVRQVREQKRPWHEIEEELLGYTHADAGACLLAMWGLPLSIVETVAYHHYPSSCPSGATDVLIAVHVADALVAHTGSETPSPELDITLLRRLGVDEELPKWREAVAGEIRKLSRVA